MNRIESSTRLFFIVLLAALCIKVFVFDIRYVSGQSMEPLLSPGNLICEFKMAWGIPAPFSNTYFIRWGKPEYGDILIYPWNGKYVVKRCIAIEGDELVFSSDRGYSVTVHEQRIPLTFDQFSRLHTTQRVPSGTLFALGVNIENSKDSREYGFVSIDSIRGKVLWK